MTSGKDSDTIGHNWAQFGDVHCEVYSLVLLAIETLMAVLLFSEDNKSVLIYKLYTN